MTTPDPAEVVRLLSRLPFDALGPAVANLTRSGNRLGRAYAYSRMYQADHDPETLRRAMDDFDAAAGSAEVRRTVAYALVERQIEAVIIGQPVALERVRRLLDEAGDDPDEPGRRAMLHAATYAASAMSDVPSCDLDTAAAVLEQAQAPAGSTSAIVLAGVRNAVAMRRAVDRQDVDALPDPLVLPDLPGGRTEPMYETLRAAAELANEAMAAMRRGDVAAVTAVQERMLETLRALPTDHPSVLAALDHLERSMYRPAPGGDRR